MQDKLKLAQELMSESVAVLRALMAEDHEPDVRVLAARELLQFAFSVIMADEGDDREEWEK